MEYRGSTVYNQDDFFSEYMKRRNRIDSPNNAIEGPIIHELIRNVDQKNILDLGCGDASFGKELLLLGANSYLGIEGSEQMIKVAETNLKDTVGSIYYSSIEDYNFPTDSFELITSRFVLHYISNIELILQKVFNSLRENGQFVFSVQHPLTTASNESKQSGDLRESWIVDDYFLTGERKEPWINKIVVKYHRTIEQYFTILRKTGFRIDQLQEGTPKRIHFKSEEEFLRRQRIPVVLVFSCFK
ncbi:bifunctional 2-polyprenyl-6-hydroxyphenol methylase/3-demethylubiquinol 3-O-methyltransferase UbiG [Bacillus sp. AFS017336]|uniref:class I SAM-dependent methyltransferase n=1 Tax=Bacillus sp. AFS017336 TaxID=2033489 RepID=UPI000BF0B4BD|nr:class I SAM-dependent methyltransferase [Bacillus sp. AFS017336]PEL10587.1 SAM-dependent methyltransferase [Bacillus sp. AFS017336]